MDILPLLALVAAALGGAVVGATCCYWPLTRTITTLRLRLDRSEAARNGALARSVQAREQIALLNRAITELRRSHSARPTPEAAPASPSQVPSDGEDKTLVLPRREAPQAFAETQLLT